VLPPMIPASWDRLKLVRAGEDTPAPASKGAGDALLEAPGIGDALLEASGWAQDVQYQPAAHVAPLAGPSLAPAVQMGAPPSLTQPPQLGCPMQPPHVVAESQLVHCD
jgi:hypothetical protein